MTKREIMVRAHELAGTMEGDYSARIALGLRQAWFEARLIAAGGRLWEYDLATCRFESKNLPESVVERITNRIVEVA